LDRRAIYPPIKVANYSVDPIIKRCSVERFLSCVRAWMAIDFGGFCEEGWICTCFPIISISVFNLSQIWHIETGSNQWFSFDFRPVTEPEFNKRAERHGHRHSKHRIFHPMNTSSQTDHPLFCESEGFTSITLSNLS
jgi:hypothetical protein